MADQEKSSGGSVLPLVLGVAVLLMLVIVPFSMVGKPSEPASRNVNDEAETRIAPVATLALPAVKTEAASDGKPKDGKTVYTMVCSACHATGAAGAPKAGDKAAWAPRIKQSYEALLTSALKGKGNMSPQGGGDHTDFEIGRAVVYMANAGGGKFEEPKAPEAPKQDAAK